MYGFIHLVFQVWMLNDWRENCVTLTNKWDIHTLVARWLGYELQAYTHTVTKKIKRKKGKTTRLDPQSVNYARIKTCQAQSCVNLSWGYIIRAIIVFDQAWPERLAMRTAHSQSQRIDPLWLLYTRWQHWMQHKGCQTVFQLQTHMRVGRGKHVLS